MVASSFQHFLIARRLKKNQGAVMELPEDVRAHILSPTQAIFFFFCLAEIANTTGPVQKAAARKSKVKGKKKKKKHADKQGRNESLDRQEWSSVSSRYLETPTHKYTLCKRDKQETWPLTFFFNFVFCAGKQVIAKIELGGWVHLHLKIMSWDRTKTLVKDWRQQRTTFPRWWAPHFKIGYSS